MSRAMGSHQSTRQITHSWITPKYITDALGPFDLDPCCSDPQPWLHAEENYDKGGLELDWGNAFVWCNPPYGKEYGKWLDKLSRHKAGGIALIFARTETADFFEYVWSRATSLLFIKGRLTFYRPDGSKPVGNSGAPSVLVGYGDEADQRIYNAWMVGCIEGTQMYNEWSV